MLSNSLNQKSQNTLSFQTYKYNTNNIPQNKIRYNTRYTNTQNKSSAPIPFNNQFLYKSENKKGFNQMTLPTFSQNNDILLTNSKAYTSISKGRTPITNSSNWNNIAFKEVKWKNNFYNKTYNSLINNYLKNNRNFLLQSYNVNNNYGATAKNLGFYNVNLNSKKTNNINNPINKNKKNLLYSKKNGVYSYASSTLSNSYNNILKNNSQKNTLYDYYKNIIQIQNAKEGLNSKIVKNRMADEENIKKINKIQAVWKGIYVRELMSYYWNFNKFQRELEKIFKNYYWKDFLNKLKNYNLNKEQKDYNKILDDYNNILKKFNEYKSNVNKNKNIELIKEKTHFEIINTRKIINNEEINSNEKEDKENIKLKSVNKNKNIKDSLLHFNKNLNIIKNDKFYFEKTKKENKKENINQINSASFSLINKSPKKISNDIKKIKENNNNLFIIENQKGFNFENEKEFNKDDLNIEKNNNFNIFNKNKINKNENENEIKKGKINQQKLLISNKSDFSIKNEEKKKSDKMTITEENNEIKTDKNIFIKENKNIEYIKNKKENKNEIKNYNLINEIEKGDALEINPYEIKRTKIKTNKISQQNNIKILVSDNNIPNQKTKNNLMKMIFPIKLKEILLKNIRKRYFTDLINKLKMIYFNRVLIKLKKNKEKKFKKKGIEKLKEKIAVVKLRNYFAKELGKYQIKNLAKKYLDFKWNKGLLFLANIIITNNIKNKNNK